MSSLWTFLNRQPNCLIRKSFLVIIAPVRDKIRTKRVDWCPQYNTLNTDKIVKEIEAGKQTLAISINETIKTTYWKIGRHIVEFEQQGGRRAAMVSLLLYMRK